MDIQVNHIYWCRHKASEHLILDHEYIVRVIGIVNEHTDKIELRVLACTCPLAMYWKTAHWQTLRADMLDVTPVDSKELPLYINWKWVNPELYELIKGVL
jgi:hypothetical protein